jgi:hypothetical protein
MTPRGYRTGVGGWPIASASRRVAYRAGRRGGWPIAPGVAAGGLSHRRRGGWPIAPGVAGGSVQVRNVASATRSRSACCALLPPRPRRHCERSEAIQKMARPAAGLLRRSAPRNDASIAAMTHGGLSRRPAGSGLDDLAPVPHGGLSGRPAGSGLAPVPPGGPIAPPGRLSRRPPHHRWGGAPGRSCIQRRPRRGKCSSARSHQVRPADRAKYPRRSA